MAGWLQHITDLFVSCPMFAALHASYAHVALQELVRWLSLPHFTTSLVPYSNDNSLVWSNRSIFHLQDIQCSESFGKVQVLTPGLIVKSQSIGVATVADWYASQHTHTQAPTEKESYHSFDGILG